MSEKQTHSERSKEADKNTSKPPAGRKNHTTSVKSGSSNDENSRKKPTVVQPAPKHGRSRGGGSAGGWDSAHQTRHDKHKEHQGITKHQKTRSEGPSRSQTRHRQTQEVKRTSSGGKGPSRNHTHKLANDRPKDSNSQLTESGGYSTADTVSTSSNVDIQDSSAQPSDTEMTRDLNNNPQSTKGDDESNDSCELNQGEDSETNRTVTNRITYDRELLLELKDCTGSLLTPLGLENCAFKEILKTSNRHSGELWDFPHGEAESEEEGRSKHPTSLALRDHDPKHVSKVSLTPQRRSFGSGCSWREGALTKHGTGSTSLENSKDPIDEDQEEEVFYSQSRTGFPNHAMRKIDHVPYRSRKDSKGDWTEERRGKGANWRNNEETLNDEDDEPEWMSFGPSDKNELMELKGLDEHELARQKDPDPEEAENPDLAPPNQSKEAGGAPVDSPPCLKESELSSGERDSGLPSSSPNEDEFILDGFDFSTGLSICHELESDSDQEVEQKTWLPKTVANEQQLTSALINVLGVGKEAGSAMNQGMPFANQIKAVTLDEIEEPVTKINDTDQSAFNNLLAVLSPSHKAQVLMPSGHNPVTTSMEPPASSRALYMNNMEELVSNNLLHNDHRRSIPPIYQPRSTLDDEHDQKWPITNWSSRPSSSSKPQLLTPSPMMLGMNPHVRHEQQPPQPGSDWAREMERRRIMELQQMREKERLQMLQQQHAMLPKKTNTSNIAFMPTSVLRKMPKPGPQVDACMPRPQHGQTSGFEKDYPLHGGMDGGGHGDHHAHPYLPQQQHLYMQYPRSNHMGRVDPHMGYTQPHPQLLQQQQIRMGIPTMKHPGYY